MASKVDPKSDLKKARESAGILLPYQAAWVGDKADVKVMEKSRRVGISWAEAADDVLYASETGNGEKRDVWYIGYNKEMALEYIGDCAKWARGYNIAASEISEYEDVVEEKKILAFRITLKSGWTVTALSSRPANLRGKQGRIVIDEAAFHEDLPGLIKAAMAMLIWGGQVFIISTHNGDENEFNSLIQDIRSGRQNYSLHRVDFDDALRQGLYKRICEVLKRTWTAEGEIEWRQKIIASYRGNEDEELFCVPSQGSGVYLTRALIETCLSAEIPVVRYEKKPGFSEFSDTVRSSEVRAWCEDILGPLLSAMDPKRFSYFGEDFGRTGDLTVILPLQELQNASFRAPFSVELRNIPFQQQEQILYYVADRLPRFRGGALDARGNGQYLAERAMQKYGASRIAQVMLSDTWYRENMPAYKAAFEDRNILLPKDADIIEDHRAFKMIKGIAKLPDNKNLGLDKKQRHGDSGIAGALAWYATREMKGGPIEFQATGVKREFTRMNAYL